MYTDGDVGSLNESFLCREKLVRGGTTVHVGYPSRGGFQHKNTDYFIFIKATQNRQVQEYNSIQ